VLAGAICAGCGTTKWTDSSRTATEQLLISDAMDRAISRMDFRALSGKTVYLDDTAVKKLTDGSYMVSTVRQHMLASGCILKENKNEADYVVELRAGAIGTDRHDVLYGVPMLTVPAIPLVGSAVPSQIPEIPFVKKTDQRAVAKIAAFAYNRKTGHPVWQSGVIPMESKAKAVWVFGAGPFQKGSIYEGMSFAGDRLRIPLVEPGKEGRHAERVSVADEAYFPEPQEELARATPPGGTPPGAEVGTGSPSGVVQTSHHAEQSPPKPGPDPPAPDKTALPAAPLPPELGKAPRLLDPR
jgi:hypothetical protein